MKKTLINWPGIIKHAGDAELIYISNQQQWDSDYELHTFEYNESDYLIDSLGHTYSLTDRTDNHVNPTPNENSMTLIDILGLVKAHASQAGTCCVAKLYATSVNDALKIVRSINEA